jgi:hypothetical protein
VLIYPMDLKHECEILRFEHGLYLSIGPFVNTQKEERSTFKKQRCSSHFRLGDGEHVNPGVHLFGGGEKSGRGEGQLVQHKGRNVVNGVLLRDAEEAAVTDTRQKKKSATWALAIWEKVLDPEHPNVAAGLNNLAELLRATNRLAEAETLYQRALEIYEKSFGPEHPNVGLR